MIDRTREHEDRVARLREAVELQQKDLKRFRKGRRGLVAAKVSRLAKGRVRDRSPPVRR